MTRGHCNQHHLTGQGIETLIRALPTLHPVCNPPSESAAVIPFIFQSIPYLPALI